jgi:hypothetical protein
MLRTPHLVEIRQQRKGSKLSFIRSPPKKVIKDNVQNQSKDVLKRLEKTTPKNKLYLN